MTENKRAVRALRMRKNVEMYEATERMETHILKQNIGVVRGDCGVIGAFVGW